MKFGLFKAENSALLELGPGARFTNVKKMEIRENEGLKGGLLSGILIINDVRAFVELGTVD